MKIIKFILMIKKFSFLKDLIFLKKSLLKNEIKKFKLQKNELLKFLSKVEKFIGNPFIFFDSDANIILFWESNNKHIELQFLGEGLVSYYYEIDLEINFSKNAIVSSIEKESKMEDFIEEVNNKFLFKK